MMGFELRSQAKTEIVYKLHPSAKGSPVMENHIKLSPGINSNSYIRQFQVAQMNFYLVNQEEQMNKKRFRWKNSRTKIGESR